jgi:hypothetical protein
MKTIMRTTIFSKLKPAYKIVETSWHIPSSSLKHNDKFSKNEYVRLEITEFGDNTEVFYNGFKNILKLKRYFHSSL